MKLIKLVMMFTILCFSTVSYSQSSAGASSTATLIAPLEISKIQDLNFGSLASSAAAGTAKINAQTGALTPLGGVTDPGTIANQVATFTVGGEGSDVITFVNDVTSVTLENGTANQLTVGLFRYSMDAGIETSFDGIATIDAGGSSTLTVGATLTIPANTPSGTYASSTGGGTGDFTITINYQ